MMRIIDFVIATVVIKSIANEKDPCKTYVELNNYRRSIAYILPQHESALCDKTLKEGWYRFTSEAGGVMPTNCPADNACGTKEPIWLRGNHPENVNETTQIVLCTKIGPACCFYEDNGYAKNCSGFFVYKLPPTRTCPTSYCAGSEKKCGKDETSPNGFTPGCRRAFPNITKDPVVSVDVENNRLRFKCKIDPEEKADNVRYEIVWYQGRKPVKRIKLDVLTANLTEAYLQNSNGASGQQLFNLGQEIFCIVQAYYEESKSKKSSSRYSNHFFAGLKISPEEIDLSEQGESKKVQLTSTVPVVCSSGGKTCNLSLEIRLNDTDVFTNACFLNLKPGPADQATEFEVSAKRDFVEDGDQTTFLKIHVPSNVDLIDWNDYKTIPSIKVKTEDVKTAICTATGDPHIITFDGLYYQDYLVGDFVLVKSNARNFKVHIRTWKCGTVSCNCGVAVQEGDEIIVIDMCRDGVPRVRFASPVEPRTTVKRDANGRIFVVNLPSGAYVRFNSYKWGANVEVRASSDDYQNTSGLCGTFDDDKKNDMTSKGAGEFRTSWQIPVKESLFYYNAGPPTCLPKSTKHFCTCKEEGKKFSADCSFKTNSEFPKYVTEFAGWKTLAFPGAEFCRRRKRRALNQDVILLPDDGNSFIFLYDLPPFTADEKSFPTPTGKTKESAQSTCSETIRNSSIGKACLNTIKNFTIDSFIDQCVVDVRVLDEYGPATESAVDTMAVTCEAITLREKIVYWKKDGSGNLAPPEEIGNNLCPNQCSGNGVCSNGKCICSNDFITADCSLKKGVTITLEGVPNDGLCDARRQDCTKIRVDGDSFIDTGKLSCKMIEAKVGGKSSPTKTGVASTTQGQLLSFREITCAIPNTFAGLDEKPSKYIGKAAGAFYIKVSNDGVNFSNDESLIIIYDSKCMECTKNGTRTCNVKANTCNVNNYCYVKDDGDPNNACLVCDPGRSQETFVQRLDNESPIISASPNQYTFKGQKWMFEISAHDPESLPLKYSFVGESYGMRVSTDGVITWIPTALKVYNFTIKVEDPCRLNATKQFSVDVRKCVCEGQNGGICKWNIAGQPENGSICVCPSGCKGERCTEPVDGMSCKNTGNGISRTYIVALAVVFSILFIVIVLAIVFLVCIKKLQSSEEKILLKNVNLRSYKTLD